MADDDKGFEIFWSPQSCTQRQRGQLELIGLRDPDIISRFL